MVFRSTIWVWAYPQVVAISKCSATTPSIAGAALVGMAIVVLVMRGTPVDAVLSSLDEGLLIGFISPIGNGLVGLNT